MPINVPPPPISGNATARQRYMHDLTKQVCQMLNQPQWMLHHRTLEGAEEVGANPNVTVYRPSGAVTDLPLATSIPIWVSSMTQQLRGNELNQADVGPGQTWTTRALFQFPAVDDNYVVINVQDDDFVDDPDGVRYKVENPTISMDKAFWICELVLWH